jgi:hypothetical protein
MFNGLTSLHSGALSLVFHAPHDQRADSVRLLDYQGKRVRLDIFVESD